MCCTTRCNPSTRCWPPRGRYSRPPVTWRVDCKRSGRRSRPMERFRNRSTSAVDEIAGDVDAILITMEGEETGGGATLPGAPPLADRVRQLYVAIEAATSLPTTEQRQLTRLSHEELTEQIAMVNRLAGSKLPALERQLDEAGVQWTPGRPIQ